MESPVSAVSREAPTLLGPGGGAGARGCVDEMVVGGA